MIGESNAFKTTSDNLGIFNPHIYQEINTDLEMVLNKTIGIRFKKISFIQPISNPITDHQISNLPVYHPSPEFIEAFERFKKNNHPSNFACLIKHINAFDQEMKKQSLCDRITVWISRTFFDSTIGQADCYIRNYVLDEKDRNYVNTIVFSKSWEWDVEELSVAKEIGTSSGGKYTGRVRNGVPHGKGTIYFLEFSYKGEFRDGKMTGEGYRDYFSKPLLDSESKGFSQKDPINMVEKIWKEGNVYYTFEGGSFDENGLQGQGKISYSGYSFDSGEFKDGLLNGAGIEVRDNSTKRGIFVEGKIKTGNIALLNMSISTVTDINKSVSWEAVKEFKPGEFIDDKLKGEGEIISQDGSVRGNFKEGKLDGYGERVIQTQKHVYDKAGKKTMVTLKKGPTRIEKGIFEDDKIVRGTVTLEGTRISSINDGKFNEYGLLNGEGEIQYKSCTEKGNFCLGKLHGYGERISLDGKSQIGLFIDGEFQENNQELLYHNGVIYFDGEGEFDKNGMFIGKGLMELQDASAYGIFSGDELNGTIKHYNGYVEEGYFKMEPIYKEIKEQGIQEI